MVREWSGPIETVSHAVSARRNLWAFCRHCGHSARLNPRDLAHKVGNLALAALARRVRCQRCGQRQGVIVPDIIGWPGRD